jgi:hypothetical protein
MFPNLNQQIKKYRKKIRIYCYSCWANACYAIMIIYIFFGHKFAVVLSRYSEICLIFYPIRCPVPVICAFKLIDNYDFIKNLTKFLIVFVPKSVKKN